MNERKIENATKAEEIILSKRGRRYGTLALAALGVLETVFPSYSHVFNVVSWGLGTVFGIQL